MSIIVNSIIGGFTIGVIVTVVVFRLLLTVTDVKDFRGYEEYNRKGTEL